MSHFFEYGSLSGYVTDTYDLYPGEQIMTGVITGDPELNFLVVKLIPDHPLHCQSISGGSKKAFCHVKRY